VSEEADNTLTRRVDDREIWVRHLLLDTEITRSGELHPKFFENHFRDAPPGAGFAKGMSGRILSLTGGNVRAFATGVIARKRSLQQKRAEFRGVVAQRVGRIRSIEADLYEVSLAEPRGANPDRAHANLTRAREWTRIAGEIAHEEILAIRDALEVLPEGTPRLDRLLTTMQLD
jgi:hypothetical protein